MLDRIIWQVGRFRSWYSIRHNYPAVRLILWVISLGILAVSLGFIVRQVVSGYATISRSGIHLDGPKLMVSWLCIMTSTVLGAWEWTLLVNALGGRLSLKTGMRIHLVSNLSKYVPGFVWPYAGKAYLAVEQGVPVNVATLSIASEFAIVYLGGILLMLLSLPFSGIMLWSTEQRVALEVGAVVITGISVSLPWFVGPRLGSWFHNSHPTDRYVERCNWQAVTFVVLAVMLTWCLLGFGFYVLDGSISLTLQNPLRLTVAMPLGLLGGQLALFVPMGIGVREAIFLALFDTSRPAALVVVFAIIFRIEMAVGEVISTLLALVFDKFTNNHQTNPNG